MSHFIFPVVGVVERASKPQAYVAWNDRDLETCPLHDFMCTRTAKHTLVAADGTTRVVERTRLRGLDSARLREIGVVTGTVSAVLSFFNFPVRISLQLTTVSPLPFDQLKSKLQVAVSAAPSRYTGRLPLPKVQSGIARARSVQELAAAISNVRPSDA